MAVAFFGDGASNEGAFHGSLNLAPSGSFLPSMCENNPASGVPASYALSVPDAAARAVAYDIPGVTVDGTDVLAVYEVAAQASAPGRGGPTLVECKTYRWRSHNEQRGNSSRSQTEKRSIWDPSTTPSDRSQSGSLSKLLPLPPPCNRSIKRPMRQWRKLLPSPRLAHCRGQKMPCWTSSHRKYCAL